MRAQNTLIDLLLCNGPGLDGSELKFKTESGPGLYQIHLVWIRPEVETMYVFFHSKKTKGCR